MFFAMSTKNFQSNYRQITFCSMILSFCHAIIQETVSERYQMVEEKVCPVCPLTFLPLHEKLADIILQAIKRFVKNRATNSTHQAQVKMQIV